ncbi:MULTISPECIES: peptide deformylase [Acidithrix]|uniref:Peptide deformylase n=2 Tax=root TaxID=1 RepID=A0A0D8HFN1_9ACTN|nr:MULTISPECIES: peptide deformylase [Acidithrix]KJF16602.1 peptide deformylase [Acidithrix ferrooxidans]
MSKLPIRTYGDPVLRQRTKAVDTIDGSIARLCEEMIEVMRIAPGVGLAANQIGISKSIFVYDIGDGSRVVLNPVITETSGEWTYEEGCLSVPGLFWPITRPKVVHLEGIDLNGDPVSIEGDNLLGRVFQHELDHLNGVLLVERLDPDQLKASKKELRKLALESMK